MSKTSVGLKNLVDEQFNGSMYACAKSLDVYPSTIWRVIRGNSNPGYKLISKINQYCKEKNIDKNNYIFFE